MRQTSSQSVTVMPAAQTLESTGTLAPPPVASSSLGHFKEIKEEDGAQEVAIGFPSSDNAVNRGAIQRYGRRIGASMPLSEDTELPPSQVSPQPTSPVAL